MDYSSRSVQLPCQSLRLRTFVDSSTRPALFDSARHAVASTPSATVVHSSSSLRLVFTQMRLQPLLFAAVNQNLFSVLSGKQLFAERKVLRRLLNTKSPRKIPDIGFNKELIGLRRL